MIFSFLCWLLLILETHIVKNYFLPKAFIKLKRGTHLIKKSDDLANPLRYLYLGNRINSPPCLIIAILLAKLRSNPHFLVVIKWRIKIIIYIMNFHQTKVPLSLNTL